MTIKLNYSAILILTVVIVTGYYVMNAPDKRSGMEKVGDAVHELPQGVDKASRQLKDRTPGEKVGDAVKDSSDDLKKSTNQQ